MRRVLTAARMRAADQAAESRFAMPSPLLMENAGRWLADAARELGTQGSRYVVVCGPGNNGGDGLVAARFLHISGLPVTLVVATACATVVGLLLLVGLVTRLAAFVGAGEMAFAYFTQHQPSALWPIENGGELAVLYCFGFLLLVFAGGGAYAVDAMRSSTTRRR